ncbi:MAG: hypothetical protein ACRDV3_14710 [Acidothermaceae bacterium]
MRIVKADKVRTGGVGGFFAREHFELSIEVDEASVAAAVQHPTAPARETARRPDAISRPVSLLDLADAISDREIQTAYVPAGARQGANSSSDMSLSDQQNDDEPMTFTPGIPTGPATPVGPSLSTDGASFASILAGLTETVAEKAKPAEAVVIEQQLEAEAVVAVRPTMAEPVPQRQPRPSKMPARRPTQQALSLRDLRDIGLPRDLLPTREDGDLLGVLVSALRALPSAPVAPTGAGEIFAVVGEGEGAWDAGVQLARSLDLDERSVVYVTAGNAPAKVAPARRVTAIDQLSVRADRWRKRATPTVAVVDAPMNVKAARWNRQALATLDAEAVWLVVPATRKTDDVARWASRLGRTDGLVVTDVDASSDPASVLQLGMPVAWLDGKPATPGAWAGLIVDRLVETR